MHFARATALDDDAELEDNGDGDADLSTQRLYPTMVCTTIRIESVATAHIEPYFWS